MVKNRRGKNWERFELFNKILNSIRKLNCPVIVEGKKDEKALRNLGYRGKLVKLNDGKSILSTVEKLAQKFGRGSKFIILMDWDYTGNILAKRLKEYGESCDLVPNVSIRQNLSSLCSKDIVCVEDLPSFIEMLNVSFKVIK